MTQLMVKESKEHWKIAPIPPNIQEYLDYKIAYPIALSLYRIGIKPSNALEYLSASLKSLSSPFEIADIDKASKRLLEAIKKQEKIIVQGDYDCDGITSAVLVEWVLKSYGANVEIFIPNRLIYDYGATKKSVDFLKNKGAKIIITVDCGITANEAVDYAKQYDIDFIITDHHKPNFDNLPNALCLINPLLNQDKTYLHTLAGVGVAFKLCHGFIYYASNQGIEQLVDLRQGLDIVAFGTIADYCPILDENRILIKNGLRLISMKYRPGIQALINNTKLTNKITPTDIMRILAPKINAAGRIGKPEISTELFMTDDYTYACKLARQLEGFNHERRAAEKKAFKSANNQARTSLQKNSDIIVVVGQNWHPGIIGVITTKLTNSFSVPCIVLNKLDKDSIYHGSGRSGQCRYDLLSLLSNIDNNIVCGGHSIAFGISVPQDKIEYFKTAVYERVKVINKTIHEGVASSKQQNIDGIVTFSQLNYQFQQQYEELSPFSPRTPAPFYLVKSVKILNWYKKSSTKIAGEIVDKNNLPIPFSINNEFINELDNDKLYNIVFYARIIYSTDNENTCTIIIKDMVITNEADTTA